jgi:CP family cyanate transporter-like MFS transporter
MTTAYVVSLTIGPLAAGGLTVPLERALGLDWRTALGMWGIFAVVAMVVWIPQLRYAHRPAAGARTIALRALLRDRLAWQVTIFMGVQSLVFYTTTAWLPTLFVSHGVAPANAGYLLSLLNVTTLVPVIVIPRLTSRLPSLGGLIWLLMVIYGIGLAGLLLAPVPGAIAWMILLGIAQGASIILAISFILGRSSDPVAAATLSSMAQGGGYTLAAIGPYVFGALRDLSGGWEVPLLALTLLLVPMTLSALASARPGYVLAAAD